MARLGQFFTMAVWLVALHILVKQPEPTPPPTQTVRRHKENKMVNLKNVLVRNDTSAYYALAEVVAICGLESVLSALAEIAAEQYVQRTGLDVSAKEYNGEILVFIDGNEFVFTPRR